MSDFPACQDCKHFYTELDLIPLCRRYAFERPDYISGKVYLVDRLAYQARENEDLCGFKGNGFELSEPEPEPRPSLISRIIRRLTYD